MGYKLVILMRKDLKLPAGKACAQAAHAAVEATLSSLKRNEEAVKKWRQQGQKKVVLKVADEKELYRYVQPAKDQGLAVAVITDAGRTVIEPGTVTCAGIGPVIEEELDRITGSLPMM